MTWEPLTHVRFVSVRLPFPESRCGLAIVRSCVAGVAPEAVRFELGSPIMAISCGDNETKRIHETNESYAKMLEKVLNGGSFANRNEQQVISIHNTTRRICNRVS